MKKKLTNISARINEDVKDSIENESQVQQISFNAMLNKILKKHVEWERFTQEIGMIYMSKSVFRNILVKINDKDLKILAATTCRAAMRDAVIYIKKELTITTLLETFDLWLSASHIHFRRVNADDSEKYIIQHDLGEKYSLYLYTAFNAVLSEIGCTGTNAKIGDQNLVFEIVQPK